MPTIHKHSHTALCALDEADRIVSALRAVPDMVLAGCTSDDEDMHPIKTGHFISLMDILIERLELALEAARGGDHA